ncbi:MAG: PadR family transcriptional regulator [Candidatus Dormibacteraceae bacterium]
MTNSAMREPTYYTLAALLDGPLHGYGIIKQTLLLSDGQVRLTAGTLYAALDRLTEAGQIEFDSQEVVDGRARRYYRLTGAGRHALQDEAARLRHAANVVIQRARPGQAVGGLV